eukprot:TRINITY_DN5555_c0_g1_i2.p1 TRINITY_DN5555_c0_g1~~TRINITY_DN5555_c0_g1_i2.p1  ORF type:complete len:193 (+),score=27.60 TRINITY_DN5555_c0_g1_i2:475-1053(+)
MEYMDIGTLKNLCSVVSFNEREIAYVLYSVVSAIKYLHKLRIIHRDVKSQNILINCSGSVKLGDFGLSCDVSIGEIPHMIGSPSSMPPEMIRGEAYGTPVDIWGLGILLIEMANGYVPHSDSDIKAMIHAVFGKYSLDYHQTWSGEYKKIIEKCLEKNPDLRITAKALKSDGFFDQKSTKEEFAVKLELLDG